jgi:hypothetical protein
MCSPSASNSTGFQPTPMPRRRLLGDERRLPLRQDDDARDQLDAPRDAGQEPEQHERLVERVPVVVLAGPASRAIGIGADHAVEGEDVRIAHRLDGLGVVTDDGRIPSDLGLRKNDADLHDGPPATDPRESTSRSRAC